MTEDGTYAWVYKSIPVCASKDCIEDDAAAPDFNRAIVSDEPVSTATMGNVWFGVAGNFISPGPATGVPSVLVAPSADQD